MQGDALEGSHGLMAMLYTCCCCGTRMLPALTHEGIRSAFGVDTDALTIRPALVLSEEFRDILNDCHLHWSSMHPAADDAFSRRYMVCQTELV
jgi:hypothetical protein